MITKYIYIKQDSNLDKALEIAQEITLSWLDNRYARVIATKEYHKTVYALAKAGIHFSKWN